MVDVVVVKPLRCGFLPDVSCSFRKSPKFVVMARCVGCPQYKRFEREMDAEDERVMDEIDEIRRTGVWK